MKIISVQSFHPCLAGRQACKSVIQTIYDIVKAHGGELSVRTPSEKVETKEGEGSEFAIVLSLLNTEIREIF